MEFEFTVPISNLKVQYALGEKFNHEMKYNSLVWEEQDFVLDVSPDNIVATGADFDKSALVEVLKKEITDMKTQVANANEENIGNFPMDTAVPFVMLFYATQFAESVET